MPPTKVSSPARWVLLSGGLTIVAALVWLIASLVGRGDAPRGADAGAPSAAIVPRSPPPRAVASRPRAGIAGHVLGPQRAPAVGAKVCAWASRAIGLTTKQMQTPRCAVTDAGGAYALDDLFPTTPLVISAVAAGFPPQAYRGADGADVLRLNEGEQREGVDFTLRAGGVQIKGRVNDVTGGGVAGALITTDAGSGGGRALTKSDAQGDFSLWVEPGQINLAATATGYAPGRSLGPAPGHFFAIHLVPGATLVGRAIMAGTETPVAGASIAAIQMEGGQARASTLTDDEGRFRVDELAPGRYRVEATAEALEGYSRTSITLGMGETSKEIVIELDPAYVVRGRVVDKATGEPCASGQVTITDRNQNEFSEAAIEPDGWARMASVIPGTYRVVVQCPGRVPRDDYPAITITDGDAPEQVWEVDAGASVRVAVIDGLGKPVASATVTANPKGDGPGSSADHAQADGTFLLGGLKPGAHDVWVQASDGSHASQEVTVDAVREERIKIELPLAGAIDGVVEDEDHRPIANVQVNASGRARASARSLDDGTFSLVGLPSGEYVVSTNERRRITQEEAEKRPPVKVTVTAPGRARAVVTVDRRDGIIEGRVADRDGKPVTDAFIDFARANGESTDVPRRGGSSRAPVVTDTDGRFKIDTLEPGEYNLRAYRKGGGEATAHHVKVGARDVALRLAAGASIAGVLTSAKGPVERFTFGVRDTKTSFNRGELFFHTGGAFTLGDLPAGTYDVTAETPGGAATAEITLAEGEQKKDVRMTLTLRGVIEGQVLALAGGTPVAGMRVSVEGSHRSGVMNSEDPSKLVTDEEGRFRVEGVLGGTWTLAIMPTGVTKGFDPASVPIEVTGGGTTNIGVVRLARHRIGAGEVRGELGILVNHGAEQLDVVSATGAAAEAGIKVGDTIVSIDGFDVRGDNRHLFGPLTVVPVGRSVTIGLARGGTVRVVARGDPTE